MFQRLGVSAFVAFAILTFASGFLRAREKSQLEDDDAALTVFFRRFRRAGTMPFEGQLETRLLSMLLFCGFLFFPLPDLLDNERGKHRSSSSWDHDDDATRPGL